MVHILYPSAIFVVTIFSDSSSNSLQQEGTKTGPVFLLQL